MQGEDLMLDPSTVLQAMVLAAVCLLSWLCGTRFGHLVSCAMDVFCYLELLSSSSRQQLSTQLDSRAQQAAEECQQQQEQQQQPDSKALLRLLRRQMSARQVWSVCRVAFEALLFLMSSCVAVLRP